MAARGGGQTGAVTLRAVAERAGVTAATVSYVLRGHQERMGITDACAQRVRAAAEALGYRGHYHAQALSIGRAATLGLTVGSGPISVLRNPYWSRIASGVESEARARGYDLLLIGGYGAMEPQERAVDQLAQRRIDGLVVLRGVFPRLLPELRGGDSPVAVVGPRPGDDALHGVEPDPVPGFHEAVRHLAQLGHRGVVWFAQGGASAPDYAESRGRLCREAAAAAGLAFTAVRLEGPSAEGATEIVRYRAAIAAGPALPAGATAVLCQNDLLALALCAELAERGVRVPEQVSVVGFDDLYSDYTTPALTTISQALPEQGRAAVAAIAGLLDGAAPATPGVHRVHTFLVQRASTGPAPRG